MSGSPMVTLAISRAEFAILAAEFMGVAANYGAPPSTFLAALYYAIVSLHYPKETNNWEKLDPLMANLSEHVLMLMGAEGKVQ